jgi:probable addiction module antidote protein
MLDKTTTYPELRANPRLIECHLNQAFQTADMQRICEAIGEAVRAQNVASFSLEAGVERAHLYKAFGSERGPRLSTMLRVVTALGLGLVAKPKYKICRQPRRNDAPADLMDRLDLLSKPVSIADYLNDAFDTSDLQSICAALSLVIQAQGNFAGFARQTEIERTSLYRAFRWPRTPEFAAVLRILDVLELRLAVKRTRIAMRSSSRAIAS